tara:strand:+ start:369 stop:1367 length:999 start_codon:yes stop_codon:yes gene_type:complete
MKPPSEKIILPGSGIARILTSRVIQSPLAGITDQTFRNLVRQWAPESLLFTEMINARCIENNYGEKKLKQLSNEKGPTGVQIFDYRPNAMIEAAKKAQEAGAFLIDINMGCPVKKISRKGGGSGLLKEPHLAAEIVRKVSNAVQIPITVKTRLGWCNQSVNAVDFCLRLEDAGAQLLTMHGRTREQGFKGNANWISIKTVKNALSIPVIANGDIKNINDAVDCLALTGADGVMIGRATMGAPWLVGQIDAALKGEKIIETPNAKQKIELALSQLEDLLKDKGSHGLLIARKHMNWTCRGFKGSSELRSSLMKANTPNEALFLLKNYLKLLEY